MRFRARTSSTGRKQFPLLREKFAALSWANLTFRSSAPKDSPPLEGLSRPHNRRRAAGGLRRDQTATCILLFSIRSVTRREIDYALDEFWRSPHLNPENSVRQMNVWYWISSAESRSSTIYTCLEIDETTFLSTVKAIVLKRGVPRSLRFDKFFDKFFVDIFVTRGLSRKNPWLFQQSIFIIHHMHEIW